MNWITIWKERNKSTIQHNKMMTRSFQSILKSSRITVYRMRWIWTGQEKMPRCRTRSRLLISIIYPIMSNNRSSWAYWTGIIMLKSQSKLFKNKIRKVTKLLIGKGMIRKSIWIRVKSLVEKGEIHHLLELKRGHLGL